MRGSSPTAITQVLAQPGQVVAAGTPVLRFAKAGTREAVVSVPESAIDTLPHASVARLYDSGRRFPAVLREVSGTADPVTRTYTARYMLATDGASAPLGSTVIVELPPTSAPKLSVPLSALYDPGTAPGVWVVAGGRVKFRRVHVLELGNETASLADADLHPGERIVALGAQLLREGERVRTDHIQ